MAYTADSKSARVQIPPCAPENKVVSTFVIGFIIIAAVLLLFTNDFKNHSLKKDELNDEFILRFQM